MKRDKAAICEIEFEAGETQSKQVKVAKAFENFYFETLGVVNLVTISKQTLSALPFNIISEQQGEEMVKKFSKDEIKEAFMRMDSIKISGPDGWNAYFFKDY